MIPSNNVLNLAADSWGVHVATDIAPIVHWNGTMGQMEAGTNPSNLLSWPPVRMVSNGNYLVLIGSGVINLLDVENSHSVIASTSASGFNNAFIE